MEEIEVIQGNGVLFETMFSHCHWACSTRPHPTSLPAPTWRFCAIAGADPRVAQGPPLLPMHNPQMPL